MRTPRPEEFAAPVLYAVTRPTLRPDSGADHTLSHDILVVTAGAVTRTFPVPGLSEEAYGLKHVEEAVAVRDGPLTSFDRAASLPPGSAGRAGDGRAVRAGHCLAGLGAAAEGGVRVARGTAPR